eukprot:CAMPEP_0171348568 /NCGR_PEP_ID=MMETSP0878-20121228/31248_1 /TAXON_ID=67004 /ORGANISM="Thalassiosira weissflogii, Strain CCMP1336" /LENGTH=91 /DNA_ID=CAMNT_0011852959 /DNA_START=357 /DNA_END=630 /DNA_ORIENTATION=-
MPQQKLLLLPTCAGVGHNLEGERKDELLWLMANYYDAAMAVLWSSNVEDVDILPHIRADSISKVCCCPDANAMVGGYQEIAKGALIIVTMG